MIAVTPVGSAPKTWRWTAGSIEGFSAVTMMDMLASYAWVVRVRW